MRIHTGERPYQGHHRDRAFVHNSDLENHQLVHTGEKPHKCSECDKSFPQVGILKIHIEIHAEATPCQCCLCGKTLIQVSVFRTYTLGKDHLNATNVTRFLHITSFLQGTRGYIQGRILAT